jgi:hypothetical protein
VDQDARLGYENAIPGILDDTLLDEIIVRSEVEARPVSGPIGVDVTVMMNEQTDEFVGMCKISRNDAVYGAVLDLGFDETDVVRSGRRSSAARDPDRLVPDVTSIDGEPGDDDVGLVRAPEAKGEFAPPGWFHHDLMCRP